MDGFYVAKIQKLSDKRPEDRVEQATGDAVEEETATKADKSKKEESESKPGKTKKGKRRNANDDRKAEKRRKKAEKISVPPPSKSVAGSKMKLNIKVTQPREQRSVSVD